MTDEEFQSIIDGVTGKGDSTAEMAECLDLTQEPTGEPEEETTEPVAEVESEKLAESVPEVSIVQIEAEVPTVLKPKVVKRKLVLKDDPRAERQKPKSTSQRCLWRGLARKAGGNTAAEAEEISSEEEAVTPKHPEEDPISAANQEEAHEETEVVLPTPTTQEEIPAEEEVPKAQVTESPAQEEHSESTEKKPDVETDEDRYQLERKRKGKAHVKKKQSNKKPRTTNTGVVSANLKGGIDH